MVVTAEQEGRKGDSSYDSLHGRSRHIGRYVLRCGLIKAIFRES